MWKPPYYPHFRAIHLDDRSFFQERFAHCHPQISEYTFTNLYIWRDYYRTKWCLWDECVCILALPQDGHPFFYPPLTLNGIREKTDDLLSYLRKQGFKPTVQRVPEDVVNQHLINQNHYEIIPSRDQSDYVYTTQDLIKLAGNKYHSKKNHINKFKKQHSYSYRQLTLDLVSECLQMENDWCNVKHCELNPGLAGEEKAIYEALKNMETLAYKGGLIEIDGKVEAFALGEQLNPQTAVIHIEKANPQFEGLYQLINQEFCAHEWGNVDYINREQDCGEEGLRKAKLSYHPHHLVNKYTVNLKDE